jgi:hypothetical protein
VKGDLAGRDGFCYFGLPYLTSPSSSLSLIVVFYGERSSYIGSITFNSSYMVSLYLSAVLSEVRFIIPSASLCINGFEF